MTMILQTVTGRVEISWNETFQEWQAWEFRDGDGFIHGVSSPSLKLVYKLGRSMVRATRNNHNACLI